MKDLLRLYSVSALRHKTAQAVRDCRCVMLTKKRDDLRTATTSGGVPMRWSSMTSREKVCSQQVHCLSCPLSVMRTGKDCRELSANEIKEIMEGAEKNEHKR